MKKQVKINYNLGTEERVAPRPYPTYKMDKEKGIVPHTKGVYGIAVNNKIKYVGSSLDMFKRSSKHLTDLRQDKHYCKGLQELYNKFGEDSFTFTILMQNSDDQTGEQLYIYEKMMMQYFRKTILNYNDVVNLKKYIMTPEESLAFKKKLSEINSGEGNPSARLTEKQVLEILDMKEEGFKHKTIADKFNISASHVNNIGKTRWLSILQ